ncbi:succinate--CoA ligase [ADP-forming] subunit beta, mitochondrial-like [Mangifera indica]|uniref:succinate--CoA ligase [ADP-forming] subunit beta, mitochondrial-like n=1 Tax=Mangifera indica TaxID=29780 RepID=UPI001CF9B0E6|nr:succinate--CoA ligase [ADP-forming] subunit beta, mitochondrial-like [Mangifera indica]
MLKFPCKEENTDEDACKVVDGLAPKATDQNDAVEKWYDLECLICVLLVLLVIYMHKYSLYICSFLPINVGRNLYFFGKMNPLDEVSSKKLVVADAKLNFDDGAAFLVEGNLSCDPSLEGP